jgi:hypothetical protein
MHGVIECVLEERLVDLQSKLRRQCHEWKRLLALGLVVAPFHFGGVGI